MSSIRSKPKPRRRAKSRAERLAAHWVSETLGAFHNLADEMLMEGAEDELAEALRLAGAHPGRRYCMASDLMVIAEMSWGTDGEEEGHEKRGFGVDLFAVAVIADPGNPIHPRSFTMTLETAGLFPPGAEVRVANGWFKPQDISRLTPCGARAMLTALAEGRSIDHPGIQAEPSSTGFSVLIGVSILESEGDGGEKGENDGPCVLQDSGDEMEAAVTSWRNRLNGGNGPALVVDVVRPCCPSLLAREIAVHLQCLMEEEESAGVPRAASRAPTTVH